MFKSSPASIEGLVQRLSSFRFCANALWNSCNGLQVLGFKGLEESFLKEPVRESGRESFSGFHGA